MFQKKLTYKTQSTTWCYIRPQKKPFIGTTNHIFPFWQIFFFFNFQNLVKSAIFWPKSKHLSWKFLKINKNIFPKFFCKIWQIFFQNCCVLRVIFATRNKKGEKCPTNHPYLAGPSACKTEFFVFVCLFCFFCFVLFFCGLKMNFQTKLCHLNVVATHFSFCYKKKKKKKKRSEYDEMFDDMTSNRLSCKTIFISFLLRGWLYAHNAITKCCQDWSCNKAYV